MSWTPKQVEAFRLLSDPRIRRIALYGGSRSGKSYTIGHKLLQTAKEFPGAPQFILRKTMADARDTVWRQTMLPILKNDIDLGFCKVYKQPALAEFSNGSFIRIGGLHPSEIDKVLGSESARTWINEASEAAWQNVPAVMTRLNDRTPHKEHGRAVIPKLIVDLNPSTVRHWTYKTFIRKVNPETDEPLADADQWSALLMNPTDNMQHLAAGYLDMLNSMSTRDRDRFLHGRFGQLKGLIYDCFDPELNVYDDERVAEGGRNFRGIDFGFVNPFVCLFGSLQSDDTLYITHMRYEKGVTVDIHAQEILKMARGPIENGWADHDAGEAAILSKYGVHTTPAIKTVKAGIDTVYSMMERRKIMIHRSCQPLISELQSYQWKDEKKDEPKKEDDHACDALRYMVMGIFYGQRVGVGQLSWM